MRNDLRQLRSPERTGPGIHLRRTGRSHDPPIFGESVMTISVQDDSGGWYFEIEQIIDNEPGKIKV